jgi:hypothetical protein
MAHQAEVLSVATTTTVVMGVVDKWVQEWPHELHQEWRHELDQCLKALIPT